MGVDSGLWYPELCQVERDALAHERGQKMMAVITARGIPVSIVGRGRTPANGDPRRAFYRAKRTLIISVKRSLRFDPCPPSADFQFPLVTGCPALCHYCYLHASVGVSPTIRAYANTEEILSAIEEWAGERELSFEASSTSDPIAVEHITGSLADAIPFFSGTPACRLRFVTKFDRVRPLLRLEHGGRTTVRFSVNVPGVIRRYEPGTAPLDSRLAAARLVAEAGYPVGFMIAPIYLDEGWETAYRELIAYLAVDWKGTVDFELVTHRFTRRGARLIGERFETDLDLDESRRASKWGKYGHVKLVYPGERMERVRALFVEEIPRHFPHGRILYFT